MLKDIDENIWVAEHPFNYLGLNVGTRMTVIRFTNDDLAVISPIQADDGTIQQLNDLGCVRHIIAPNLFHHLFISDFKALYPDATLHASAELMAKRPEIAIDKVLDNDAQEFNGELVYQLFAGFQTFLPSGISPLNEYVFFHPSSQTLILTDTAFHFDESFPWTTQLVARIIGGYKQLRPSRIERFATQAKEQVRQSVQSILEWDFERVIVAHGSIVEHDAKQQFKEGYEWFLD